MFDPATDDPENRRRNMGRVKDFAQDWLERGGHELGYDMGNLPALGDFDSILSDDISADEYFNNTITKGNKDNEHTSKRHRKPSSPK